MVKRKNTIFCIVLFLGFVLGILFQRTFTVGQTYRQIISLFREPDTRPVAIRRKVQDPIDWGPYSEDLTRIRFSFSKATDDQSTVKKLRKQIPIEIEFRSSQEVQRTYRILNEVKKDNGITHLEVQSNLSLRREEVEYQSDDRAYDDLWNARYEAVIAFHRHLRKRGIHLLFMPVPNKVDIELPRLMNSKAFVSSSPRNAGFLLRLAENGVDVIDLRYEMGERSLSGLPMFNRFDHHWTPQAVELGAQLLTERIRLRASELPAQPIAPFEYETVVMPEPVLSFPERWEPGSGTPTFARSVRVAGKAHQGFSGSKIVVLGDSMVLMYQAPHPADLGSHVSALLGYPCETIGKGSGSPLVPKMFFSRYGTTPSKSDPQFVVWVGVSRHQDYKPVDANSLFTPETGRYQVTILDRPQFPDLATVPYPDAIYAFEALIEKDSTSPRSAKVFAPAFRNRKLVATGTLNHGDTREMNLIPWQIATEKHPPLRETAIIDQRHDLHSLEFYWNGE